MGCGSSSYPVAIETEDDPKQDASFQEDRESEKHVPSQSIPENLDANTKIKQTEEAKISAKTNQDKTEDKRKVSTTRHGSSDINKVSSPNLQVFQDDSCNSRGQSKGNAMQVGDVANIQNERYFDSHKDERGIKCSVMETTVLGKSGSDIQGTAYLSSNQEIVESEKGINSEKTVEKDAQIENKMATPAEAEDRVIVQNECLDSATIADEGVAEGHIPIINETEAVIQLPVKLPSGDCNEKENCNVENHDERHIDQEITTCITTEVISDEPSSPETMPQMSSHNLDANGESVSQKCLIVTSNQTLLEEGKPLVAQDDEHNSHTNDVALSPLSPISSLVEEKMHNEIILEQTSMQNVLEKESEKSLHEHENTISVIILSESQHKIRNDETSGELFGIDVQNMNPETAFNCPVKRQAANLIAVNEENTAVSSCLGDQEKGKIILTPLEDSNVDAVTAQNSERANLVPTNGDMPCVKDVSLSRDMNAENMLIAALRLSCKLSPGNLVKDLDIKGVMSLHLMRSLSPGEITVAELVWKLDNLTELDLSGNLLGPQGFRVICLALRRNTSIKMLNLANNLADTDCSECIGMMLSTNVYLEKLDVSGNNLGNDYFSRCVGPALNTNKSLKVLRFSSCGSTDASSICEAIVEGNTSLQELDASSNHFGAAAFGGGLSKILQKPGCCLRHLDVHGTHLEKEGMTALLEGIQHNTSLVSLNAAGNEVASLSFLMDFLYSCICHPTLEELILERTKVLELDEWQPPDAPAPEGSSNITKLILSGCSLTNKALQTLTAKVHVPGKLHALINLDLSNNNQLTADCLSSIATMISLEGQSSLSTLDFSLNVSDDIALEMEQLPELKNVKTLVLKKCRVNPPSVVELSKFIAATTPSFPQISSLTLDGIKMSGTGTLKGMLGLSDTFIPTNPCGLELLSLTGCVLNDRDVKPLLTALGNGLVIKELRLSANRLTDAAVTYLVDSGGTSLSLQALDLSINKVRNGGAEKLSQALSDKLKNLKTLSLADNDIGKTGILGLVGRIYPASQLAVLNLKSQRQPVGEEDMDEIMEQLARTLGFDPESNGGNSFACCNFPPNLSVNLTGLGGEPGEMGPKLDSLAIMTDYSSKHRRTLTLKDALQLSAVLSHAQNATVQMSQRDWNLVISADKDAPAWLQLASQRESAIYVTNLPLSVTAEKLEGLLDSEAECNVKEFYLLKDQILRKPNGLAWVLFSDTASVQRAVEYYNSGHAFMYGTPFVISTVNVDVVAEGGTEENVEAKARQEMIQRAEDRKADQTARAQLVHSNYQDSLVRHEYAAQHPAYADGRVW